MNLNLAVQLIYCGDIRALSIIHVYHISTIYVKTMDTQKLARFYKLGICTKPKYSIDKNTVNYALEISRKEITFTFECVFIFFSLEAVLMMIR